MSASPRPRLGVVLANLGTPDAPTPSAVRRFLREFLSDRRVIEVPRPLWWLILNLFILPFRPRRVAHLYQAVWEEKSGSPMRRILKEQCRQLAARLQGEMPAADLQVLPAMSYGQPSVASALDALQQSGVEAIVVLPLFPQYSATSTAPVYDAVQRWSAARRNLPTLTLIKDYHAHPRYITALANAIRAHRDRHGEASRLLFSFHGIPEAYAEKGDPYPLRCRETAVRVAAELALPEGSWAFAFQSRFGSQPWVQPYTDVLLQTWAKEGVESVQVICPGFAADCLETLEEIALQNREGFLQAGGKRYEYIPALNAGPDHVEALATLVQPHLEAYQRHG